VLHNKIRDLNEAGMTREWFLNQYSVELLSKNKIIEIVNAKFESTFIHKKWLSKIFDYHAIPIRSASETNRLRMEAVNHTRDKRRQTESVYGKGKLSKSEIIEFYKAGRALSSLAREYGVAVVTSSKIIKDAGEEVKRSSTYKEILSELGSKGYNRPEILKAYVEENRSIATLALWMQDIVKNEISESSVRRALCYLGISKPKNLIGLKQGERSRAELVSNLEKLLRAGYASPQALANHYEKNIYLTRAALIKQLNSTISSDETPFTQRWLTRHIDPHLSEDRLKGTSRIEKEFIAHVRTLTDGDLMVNTRSIINPYELDAYLPELKIAIEFNGDFWHSDKFLLINYGMTSFEYHSMKLRRCIELGIDLFFVWESDWNDSRDLIVAAIEEILEDSSKRPEILRKLTMDEIPEESLLAA
jgi:hypothetical protein